MTQIITRVAGGSSLRVSLPGCASGLGAGTGVMTTEGLLPVEYLCPGDGIVTHDAGCRRLSQISIRRMATTRTVRLRPALWSSKAQTGPTLTLSGRQKLVLRDWRARILFGRATALVEAERLTDGEAITRATGTGTTRLFQLRFEDGQHVLMLEGGVLAVSAPRLKAFCNTAS